MRITPLRPQRQILTLGVSAVTALALLSFARTVPAQTCTVESIAAGLHHSFVILRAGSSPFTHPILGWGRDHDGQLGDACLCSSGGCPEQVFAPTPVFGFNDALLVAGSEYHSLAIRGSDHSVWAWGFNSSGELGLGDYVCRSTPARVKDATGTGFLGGITAISAGEFASMALDSSGQIWTWGNNLYGLLGINSLTPPNSSLPVSIDTTTGLSSGSRIRCGEEFDLASTSSSTFPMYAWGHNQFGQIGDNTTSDRFQPTTTSASLLAGKTITSIGGGEAHSLVGTSDGYAFSWGTNGSGQLGNPSAFPGSLVPVPVLNSAGTAPLSGVLSVAAGELFSVALMSDGTVLAWGRDAECQLGQGGTAPCTGHLDQPLPVLVTGLSALNIKVMDAGDGHVLVATEDASGNIDKVFAWGMNDHGQVGTGNTTDVPTPTEIPFASFDPLPPDQGNNLLAVKLATDVLLSFAGVPAASSWKLFRNITGKADPFMPWSPELAMTTWIDPGAVAASPELWFYKVAGLSPCTGTPGPI